MTVPPSRKAANLRPDYELNVILMLGLNPSGGGPRVMFSRLRHITRT